MSTTTSTTPPRSASVRPARAAAFNGTRLLIWGGFALILLCAPMVFKSSLAITMLSQMGIGIVACLSFNILLGQGGMLSFGHAVYSGLASYVTIHALNGIAHGTLPLPVSLLPVLGGLIGIVFAVVLGYVTTKKAGTTFAMITMGIGELIYAMTSMVPEFFGGEGGISANRTAGGAVMGITFGPQIQVYYLLAIYTFICTAAMYAFTHTPLGRMLNAVRDNPERVEFVGYNTQRVRYISFIIAGFFAGIAGGMYALNFEIATAEVVSGARSALYLFFTFLGGMTFFFGPIIGAVLMVLAFVLFSEYTKAWPLYLGLIFVFMVMYAPGGIASLIMMNVRVAAHGKLGRLIGWYVALAVTALIALIGLSAMVEMIYHLQLSTGMGTTLNYLGTQLDPAKAGHWIGALAVAIVGIVLLEITRRRFAAHWSTVQTEIEAETRRDEVAA